MKYTNGSIDHCTNYRDFLVQKEVEKTERYLIENYSEFYTKEVGVNNPMRRQKALAMDPYWKGLVTKKGKKYV